jgi:hypothetical protein
MPEQAPMEMRQNSVTAAFVHEADAQRAMDALRVLGIHEMTTSTSKGRVVVTLNAGQREQDARVILAEHGAELRNQPG